MSKKTKLPITKQNRKKWFHLFKRIFLTGRYKRPEFIFLGEGFKEGSVILSNHEGTDAPLSLELYSDTKIRLWGTAEMNSGLVKMYKYQSRYYYHEKKHWNLHLARLFCLIASPLTNIFYSGLNLISTYHDVRFIKTLKESVRTIKGGESVVIFPEDSTNGYLDQLEGFHAGCVMLMEYLYKKGIDVPVYVTYFKKKELKYIVDKPVLYSKISADCKSRQEVADKLLNRCNELGRMTFDEKGAPQESDLSTKAS